MRARSGYAPAAAAGGYGVIRVYSAANLQDAHILLGLLLQAGIAARVLNAAAQGGLGEIPFANTYPEIWIERERDREAARGVVEAFEHAPRGGPNRRCPACGEESPGNFELCWQCGEAM